MRTPTVLDMSPERAVNALLSHSIHFIKGQKSQPRRHEVFSLHSFLQSLYM